MAHTNGYRERLGGAEAGLQRRVSPVEQEAHAPVRERVRVQVERGQRAEPHDGAARPHHQERSREAIDL